MSSKPASVANNRSITYSGLLITCSAFRNKHQVGYFFNRHRRYPKLHRKRHTRPGNVRYGDVARVRSSCRLDFGEWQARILPAAHQTAALFRAGRWKAKALSLRSVFLLRYTVAPMDLKPGMQLGPYEIRERLGAGGMGEVYLARDSRLQRDVAIKVLRPGVLIDEAARHRFRNEALALARLNHPNIAVLYDVGEREGVDYLVMEYVSGPSLGEKLSSGPLGVQEALSLAIEIAAALEEAHEQGVVHRDLKPGNVALTAKGHAKVLDFGLAKLLEPARETTLSELGQTRGPIGTLLYMSPEQAEGLPLDARTDLWSLGAILYECLAGKPPFDGNSTIAVLHALTTEKVKSVHEVRPDAPAQAERIVSRALEKDRNRRYQTASEMKNDLAAALEKVRTAHSRKHEVRMSRARWMWSIAAVLLIAIAGGWFYWQLRMVRWAQEKAVPEMAKLRDENKPLAAFLLAQQAHKFLPDDKPLNQAISEMTQRVSIDSSPEGAKVEIQDYLSPKDAWYSLGTTPLKNVEIPQGYFRWRLTDGQGTPSTTAPETGDAMTFDLAAMAHAPAQMVYIPGGGWGAYVTYLGWVGPFQLPPFYMDKYEVTNRDYQRFVDAGGYEKPDYWKEQFLQNGQELSWQEAMKLFRDSTGRHGPSTWEAGHFRPGQDNYPVSGVSWYEAAAYAVYAGKSLPTLAQWYSAISEDDSSYVTLMSNIDRQKLEPVGSFQNVGDFGTYDMAGNVHEWILQRRWRPKIHPRWGMEFSDLLLHRAGSLVAFRSVAGKRISLRCKHTVPFLLPRWRR